MRKILKTKKYVGGWKSKPKSAAMLNLKSKKAVITKKEFSSDIKEKIHTADHKFFRPREAGIKKVRRAAGFNAEITKKNKEIGNSQQKITNLTSKKLNVNTKHAELELKHTELEAEKTQIEADIKEGTDFGTKTPEEIFALKEKLKATTDEQSQVGAKIVISGVEITKAKVALNSASAEHSKKEKAHAELTKKSALEKKRLGIDEISQGAFISKVLSGVPINKKTGEPDVKKQEEAIATIEKEQERIKILTEGIAAKAINITTKPEKAEALEAYKKAKKELKQHEAEEEKGAGAGVNTGAASGIVQGFQSKVDAYVNRSTSASDVKDIMTQMSAAIDKQTQVLGKALQGQGQAQQGPPKKLSFGQKIAQAFRKLTGRTNKDKERKANFKAKVNAAEKEKQAKYIPVPGESFA